MVLYIDGQPAQEKAPTIADRADRRQKALESTTVKLRELEVRINDGLRVRKHHFRDVISCTTEADVAIAQACKPTDIVLSRDSDMLYYASIRTIWRPISKGRVLVYDVQEVMATLGLNQAQFTVLGMVSRNDYNRNIPSLGSATNYTIVKELKEQDPCALLGGYLRHGRVVLKNTNQENFAASRRVFLELSQTILQSDPVPSERSLTYDGLQEKFQALSQSYLLRQERLKEARQAEK
ncbi:hypothetical protein BGZ70_004774, partial [Mortierella alpina]